MLLPRPAVDALRFEESFGEEWSSEAEGESGSWFPALACGSGVISSTWRFSDSVLLIGALF